MNPNSYTSGQGYYSPSNYGPPAHAYPGSMSPCAGGPPMSPYSQGQGQSPTQQSIYANQNSQYSGAGGGGGQSPGGYTPYPPIQSMQNYYNNQSPTHSVHYPFGPGQVRPGHPEPPRGPAPHPMGLMMGSRIPHPMNSPNQNVTGNQIKTENADLKVGGGPQYPQGYNQSAFGFNGYGGGTGNGGPRPILSPMSPHGRTNISPGAPSNLSPRDQPPNMSPHPGVGSNLYSNQESSPGNNAISTIASQASTFPHQPPFSGGYEYFNKQTPPVTQMQPSPLSQGSGYGGGGHKDELGGGPAVGSYPTDDKLSDVQSNASAGETPQHPPFNDENGGLANLVKKEKISDNSGDINNSSNKPGEEPPSIKQEVGGEVKIKTEKLEGFNYDDGGKGGGYGGGMMEGMNLDSIPELPDIPELKYEDVGSMDRRHMVKEGLFIPIKYKYRSQPIWT